ncbi:MAG: hypothetical protein GW775_02430 [Candidatus Magasanikbacteria bacterium]|uniref:DUF6938 domain-containing protein n=1 Tax=Candidatus Magasanikbacteria bacterium CG10_big_fil_rev_8_21_14_0_10_38_6 TaxID=1974647 RepID=A0A2M6P233_9BACT|nr:hypothetical protein [Candidatus Magasanikbacteria bacterium]PIR77609.1 MAG: hypothetical protein COU30_01505 [Candidatus Magasanikbacteria bacterium CG10_big_fil_rev_8_21_14_0_10_38_6]
MAKKTFTEAYIVTVDMGYGHQRAVYPLKGIAATPVGWKEKNPIISANNYAGIPISDRTKWEGGRKLYETVSRMKGIPIIGNWIFGIMDYLQRIEPFYPKRDLSKPTAQLKQVYGMVKGGMGKHLIDTLNKKPVPYITSFFTTAFFAEVHGYKGPIYCLCTDTDISRAWVSPKPKKSKIIYFAPNYRVKERLKCYGVQEKNIHVTGFPLPKENIDEEHKEKILKIALGDRIQKLDPEKKFQQKYQKTIEQYLGDRYCKRKVKRPLTIMFAVGGAGAQREIGATILRSLKDHINNGEVRLFLVAGSRNDVYRYYESVLESHCKKNVCGIGVQIIYAEKKMDYFSKMSKALNETDIIWTKPSEMSFYAGLGLPIIMSPTIGSQEKFNRSWLHNIGAGFEQEDPQYTHEWLFDWLETGWLAQAAMEGYLDAPRHGTYLIEDIVLRGKVRQIKDTNLL